MTDDERTFISRASVELNRYGVPGDVIMRVLSKGFRFGIRAGIETGNEVLSNAFCLANTAEEMGAVKIVQKLFERSAEARAKAGKQTAPTHSDLAPARMFERGKR